MYGDRGFGDRGYGDRGGFRSFAPVKVGDELDVKIEAVGEKGDGIAKKDGFVLFVPNTKAGQEVRIRVTKVLRKVGFAEVIGEGSGAPQSSKSEKEEAAPEDTENFGEESGSDDEAPDAPEEEKEYAEESEETSEETPDETSEETE